MKKIFIAAMLAIILSLGLCACTASQTPSEPEASPSPTFTPKSDLTIADFSIVIPKTTIFQSNIANEEASAALWNAIRESSSAFVNRNDDSEEYIQPYEILIGNVNRDEAELEKHLKYYDYTIKYVGTKLIIKGGSDEALTNAVNYFIDNYVSNNIASTVDGWNEISTLDYESTYQSNIDKLSIDGVYINEFKISSNIRSDIIDMFISQVLEKTGEKLECPQYITNWEHEIIIGDCGKPEYNQVAQGLKGNDYVIDVVNGKLVIASASDAGLTHALYKFYSEYLNQKTENLNITSDIKYVYNRKYPIDSMSLCGYDIKDYVIVANKNSKAAANRLSKEIEEMTGVSVEVVTDSPDNYSAAIVLCGVKDSTSVSFLSALETGKALVKSEGSKIYIGTNSISYGDSPAVNVFITEVLGYDMNRGVAANTIVDIPEINVTADIEDYRSKFEITHFFGIRQRFLVNEDGSINTWRIDEAVEAGFNVLEIGGSPETIVKVLEYCDKRGDVRCNILDPVICGIGGLIRKGGQLYDGWMDDVKAAVDRYKGYSSLYMYHIVDEPWFDDAVLEDLGALCALLEELDPARVQYINCVPLIDWIGGNDMTQYDKFLHATGIEMLSYDRYVFDDKNGRENAPIAGYYDNLEPARNAALKYNTKYMNIALLVDHFYDQENGTVYRYLNEAEISWQAFNSLAYGVNAFSYFTYASPKNGTESDYPWVYNPEGGAISVDGEKTEHYYNIQNVNRRLQIMGDVLVDRQSLAVFHIEQPRVISEDYGIDRIVGTKFEGYGSIDEIIVSDATIGFFEDNFMVITNKDFDNAVDVEVKTSSKLLILDCESGDWNELDSKSFSLEAGNAALIKIIE